MPVTVDSLGSPTRLPLASKASDSRPSTPTKSPSEMPVLAPLKPPAPPPAASKPKQMPPPSAALVAGRLASPPTSPLARDSDAIALTEYALSIHVNRMKPPRDSTNTASAKPAKSKIVVAMAPAKRVTAVPKLLRLPNNNAVDQQQQKSRKHKAAVGKKLATNSDRGLDAGVYVLENRKTGHRFVGTTWDLRNAAAQSFADLEAGSHPHRALVTSFKTYGADASGISFRVLERVAVPTPSAAAATAKPTRKQLTTPDFDVHAMESLLHKRLLHHQRQLVRKCALRLVQRRLIVPLLAQFWPVWTSLVEQQRDREKQAAAVVIQSVGRMRLAKTMVTRQRRHRAAIKIAQFVALCAMKRVLWKRRQRQRRHASATRIQRCVLQFLRLRRHQKRSLLLKKWLGARHIQRVFRGYKGRQKASAVRRCRRREDAARVMQALARGFLARCAVSSQRHKLLLYDMASRIQARWRGVFTRQVQLVLIVQAKRHDHAARVLQAFYRRFVVKHKLTSAAQRLAFQSQQVTRIHAAYKNYLAKKFGWAAMTYQLEHSSAARIQKSMRRWFFFARVARLSTEHRRETASRALQRVWRGHKGRLRARRTRVSQQRSRGASRLQRLWRIYQGRCKLHAAVAFWCVDRSARRIQSCFRGFRQRRVYAVIRTEARRERAATRIQSAFRMRMARREWKRRVELTRKGAIVCKDCGDALAAVVSWQFRLELCLPCSSHYASQDGETLMEINEYRRQHHLALFTQRVYRGFQVRAGLRYGVCGLCEQRAVRIACRSCPRRFCHSCDALFHKPLPKRHDRLRVEEFLRQEQAALVLQKHTRRYAHRHTIAVLKHEKHTQAALTIQTNFKSRRQRRHTRALVVAQHELAAKQRVAAFMIQRCVRGFLARRYVQQLRQREKSAVLIQKVVRGALGRRQAWQRRAERDAAVCIQRHVRGIHGRRVADERRREVEEITRQKAAVAIQSRTRGYLLRRRLWREKCERMAIRIQNEWRRNRAKRVLTKLLRERDERLRLEREAAERVRQAKIREQERVAATRIQCAVRRRLARQELQRRRLYRAKQKRLEQLALWLTVERKSATYIQRCVRKHWLVRARQASLKIQCAARQWAARRQLQELRQTKKAATCIQRAFRYARVKRKLSKLVLMESTAVAGTVGGWVELFDEESGCVYYYNRETMASQWVKPPELMGDAPTAAAAQAATQQYYSEYGYNNADEPPEWVEYWDENVGTSYYYNTLTGEATWATPASGSVVAASSTNQSEDGDWAWPPGAPVDGKDMKYYQDKQTLEAAVGNQEESMDPAGAEWNDGYGYGYGYTDAEGNTYAYDYGNVAGYDANAAEYYNVQAPVAGGEEGEGFDDSAVDTSYDLNYQIFMTQLQRDSQQQQQQQEEAQGE